MIQTAHNLLTSWIGPKKPPFLDMDAMDYDSLHKCATYCNYYQIF